ncbi:MAG TPA: hypothetical protein VJL89_11340 [Thermodesulfovibrionia bacterium]|nr:hypothetical protein [Thermodesulfovibrionia bacterium]
MRQLNSALPETSWLQQKHSFSSLRQGADRIRVLRNTMDNMKSLASIGNYKIV